MEQDSQILPNKLKIYIVKNGKFAQVWFCPYKPCISFTKPKAMGLQFSHYSNLYVYSYTKENE